MGNILLYNGTAFAAVHSRNSIVVPFGCREVWRIVGNFGTQALWMGEVEGQHIFTQLLGGVEQDYVGACRVFGIADKLIFEQLTRLDDEEMVMCWQGISHPKNSNPFPASFLNFKATLKLAPVLIPGRQTFIDWSMEFMTETHAVSYMRESMNSIMRIALLNLQKFMAMGSIPTSSLEMAIRPPSFYGINTMPQPISAPMLLHQHSQTNLVGSQGLKAANATYMPPPLQQTAPIFSSERIDSTLERLEPTVPLLHQAHPATHLLAAALQEAHAQAANSSPILRPATSGGGGYGVGEYPWPGSAAGGAPVGEDPPRRLGGSLEDPPGWAAGSAHHPLAVSAAGYHPHLVSAGTLMAGGHAGAAEQAAQPGSHEEQQQPARQRELSLHPSDFADAQGLAPTGGGSMPAQPSQASIRALLASQSLSAARSGGSGPSEGSSTFPGFQTRPQRPTDAAGDVQRIDSGVSLDSLSLADVGRSSQRKTRSGSPRSSGT